MLNLICAVERTCVCTCVYVHSELSVVALLSAHILTHLYINYVYIQWHVLTDTSVEAVICILLPDHVPRSNSSAFYNLVVSATEFLTIQLKHLEVLFCICIY